MFKKVRKNKKIMALIIAGFVMVGSLMVYHENRDDTMPAGKFKQVESDSDSYNAEVYEKADNYEESALEEECEQGHSTKDSPDPVAKEKMIISWDIRIETEEFKDTIKKIEEMLKKRDGYIENQSEYSQNGEMYASFTLRIPEKEGDSCLAYIDGLGTIISKSKNSQNVSLHYIDTESRLKSLKTERKTLYDILEKTDNLSDVLELQGVLQNINYEIESYESQIRSLKNSIDYMTINIDIEQVSREHIQNPGMGEEIRQTFTGVISSLQTFGRWLLVILLGYSPLFILIALIVIIVRKLIKRKKGKQGNITDVK